MVRTAPGVDTRRADAAARFVELGHIGRILAIDPVIEAPVEACLVGQPVHAGCHLMLL